MPWDFKTGVLLTLYGTDIIIHLSLFINAHGIYIYSFQSSVISFSDLLFSVQTLYIFCRFIPRYVILNAIMKVIVKVTQSCLTFCMDCSLPDSSVHEISQARTLEWFAISFSRGSSWPRDRTRVSLHLQHWQADSLPQPPPGKPYTNTAFLK